MKYRPLFKCLHGSHLYGLDTPESDKDYKGVFMPDIDELLLGTSPKQISHSTGSDHSKNSSEDIDTTWYSLPEFIKLASQGETIALDMLYADTNPDCIISWSYEWEYIAKMRNKFITKDMKAFLGYAKKQAHKYGVKGSRMGALEELMTSLDEIVLEYDTKSLFRLKLQEVCSKLPNNAFCKFMSRPSAGGSPAGFYEVLGSLYQLSITLEEFVERISKKWQMYGERARAAKNNEGVDWKAVSHAVRAGYQLRQLYAEGKVTYPLKDAEYLLSIKTGELDFTTQVQPELERVIQEVELLSETSQWANSAVDKQFWDKFLLNSYKGL